MTVRPLARSIILTDAGAIAFDPTLTAYDNTPIGSASPEQPGAVFSELPTIQSDGTPQVGEQLTGVDGTVLAGTISTRAWLLAGTSTVLTTTQTYTPQQAGDYVFRVTATGAAGTTPVSASATITVAAATPTPTPGTSYYEPGYIEDGYYAA